MAGYPLASWQAGLHQPFKEVHNTSGMGQKVLLLKTLTCGWDTGDKKCTEACQRQRLEDLRLSWTEKSERLWSQLNCTVINGINICSLLSKCLKIGWDLGTVIYRCISRRRWKLDNWVIKVSMDYMSQIWGLGTRLVATWVKFLPHIKTSSDFGSLAPI